MKFSSLWHKFLNIWSDTHSFSQALNFKIVWLMHALQHTHTPCIAQSHCQKLTGLALGSDSDRIRKKLAGSFCPHFTHPPPFSSLSRISSLPESITFVILFQGRQLLKGVRRSVYIFAPSILYSSFSVIYSSVIHSIEKRLNLLVC